MVSQEVFKNIRRIQISTTHLVDDLFAGAYHSLFKGRGIEFEEVRPYLPGDDVRSIDWNVTARMQDIYVKNYREERELTVMLVVDVSSSERFGSTNRSKSELIAEMGAVLAFSAIKNNDKVGMILFSSVIEKYIPPKKGLKHVLRVIRELLAFRPQQSGTDIETALTFLGKTQRRKTICFLISDFICPEDYTKAMALTAKKFDLTSIAVTDPYELQFPKMGLTHLKDLETGKERIIDTSHPLRQEQFQASATTRIEEQKKLMDRLGAGFIPVMTNVSYVDAFRKYFALRRKQ